LLLVKLTRFIDLNGFPNARHSEFLEESIGNHYAFFRSEYSDFMAGSLDVNATTTFLLQALNCCISAVLQRARPH
jgi:hypothetical protein